MAEIVLDHLTKRFPDGALAVNDVSLDIADGEFVILVGPSGCGKSTTLNMIAGLEDITEGELRIAGKVVNDKAPKDRDIAMVFQSYALYPLMTVRENMGFALKLAKTPKATIDEKVTEAARILDLTQHLDRRPANLSGGQRQRVAMGRAIVRDPSAFLMDEPLSNLDAKLRVQMRTEVSRIQRRLGTTMVYVTHDQVEAMTLADVLFVLNKGIVEQAGAPLEVFAKPATRFVAGFLGSPAMNFVDARLERGDGGWSAKGAEEFSIPVDEGRFAGSLEQGKAVTVGVRPHDVRLVEEDGIMGRGAAASSPPGPMTSTASVMRTRRRSRAPVKAISSITARPMNVPASASRSAASSISSGRSTATTSRERPGSTRSTPSTRTAAQPRRTPAEVCCVRSTLAAPRKLATKRVDGRVYSASGLPTSSRRPWCMMPMRSASAKASS